MVASGRKEGLFGSGLPLSLLSGVTAATVVLFLLWGSPLWLASREDSHVARIAFSYLAAVPLVAAALLALRRFRWSALFTGLGVVWAAKLLITSTLFFALARGPAAEYSPAAPWEAAQAKARSKAPAAERRTTPGAEVAVVISKQKYTQETYRAAPGDRLVLANQDSDLHTLRLTREGRVVMNTPVPAGTASRSVAVPHEGTYQMTCDNHPSERAVLTVAEAPGGT